MDIQESCLHLRDGFIGSIMGTALGDALGQGVEGWPASQIQATYGWLDRMVDGWQAAGAYTDDTEMMLGILETLVMVGGFDPEVCAQRFVANYNPGRGYGGRIGGIMQALRQGQPWQEVGTDSFGNGSAMRIGPLGAFYFDDLARLKEMALLSCLITHKHPEAQAGAVAQATGVALALKAGGRPVEADRFTDIIQAQIADLCPQFAQCLESLRRQPGEDRESQRQALRQAYRCDVRSIEAVPPALGTFLWTRHPRQAMELAVNLGGDTDTLGAMAGALAGAYYGYSRLPTEWLAALESGPRGRDFLLAQADLGVQQLIHRLGLKDP
ncbi:MAG: ADP-ribosylglycohydrolase family protein [Desulfobacteraceae bacterium]